MTDIWHANQAQQETSRISQVEIKAFEQVLKKCAAKIAKFAEHGKTECPFSVPKVIFGQPLIDQQKCITYLLVFLQKLAYHVARINDNVILISWGARSLLQSQVEQGGQVAQDQGNCISESQFN
jgi:hypothetical protein